MKIYVYAIAKDEEQFAERWYNTVKEADGVYVLVNNSTDRTAEILSSLGAVVQEMTMDPFRFDAARNMALALVPANADLCVCSDLDDIWPQGWRYKLEQQWHGEDCLRYKLLTSNGDVWTDKIHTRKGWIWKHACHEVLEWVDKGTPKKGTTNIEVQHCPDHGKARDYLPLLELDAKENPIDARALHYLGREYMYREQWPEAIRALGGSQHYETWDEQKSATYRFLSRCEYRTDDVPAAKYWLYRALACWPSREVFVDLAWLCQRAGEWAGVVHFVDQALKITEPGSYPSEAAAWGDYPQQMKDAALEKLTKTRE